MAAPSPLPFISSPTPNASAIGSFCSRMGACAGLVRLMIFARAPARRRPAWRMYFLRSPDLAPAWRVPLVPLLTKEVVELLSGRALWTMLLILCPLVGFSFFQAVALYGEASAAARDQPVLATSLSPLDGILVPTFGAFYVAVTLLFPFVAIRALGHEKETGALKLLVQLPYQIPSLVAAKLTAISVAWLIGVIPVAAALLLWVSFGGHLSPLETSNLLLGHLLYGLLIVAIALFLAEIWDICAHAAIVTLAF